ncbi:MAG: cobalamin-dependent protein, partial [Desulfatitalea sp.]|nr:cobalamin-dependent protein [Desulfatitalea sp.]
MTSPAKHPLGTRARILLSSVFGPYAQDDAYGSRKINPMELYQNQVTRTQGAMSLRMFHRSFGLLLLQANIQAPCSVLDFPSRDRFIREIQENPYDIIGISGIIPNTAKVIEMCALVRQYQPRATLVVGGHIANKSRLDQMIDVDHIVKGDGVRWFRQVLGQDENAPVKHPSVPSGFGTRILGMPLADA